MNLKKFDPLSPSSKFAICGLPIRLDSYRTCSFGCKYCFANYRTLGTAQGEMQVGNITSVKNRLKKVFDKNEIEKFIFLDYLIANRYTWHCGGMSDPFQPAEKSYQITKSIVDITNDYNINILFSTKSDTHYETNLKPSLHSFQLSITNINNRKDIETNVPNIDSRYAFFCDLKNKGFKVGIRIQPFIPNISSLEILEKFKEADHFTIEGLKMVPTNLEQRKEILKITKLSESDFKNMGLLNLKPEIRLKLYEPFIKWLNFNKKSYSIADNDLHYLGNNYCCCGDELTFKKYTNFNNTFLTHSLKNTNYSIDEVLKNLKESNLLDCKCKQLFFSNRQKGCETVKDFYEYNFDKKNSPFSPKFLYIEKMNK